MNKYFTIDIEKSKIRQDSINDSNDEIELIISGVEMDNSNKKKLNNEPNIEKTNDENKIEGIHKSTELFIDEEKKKEIFNQIEKEIDKLKISNFNEEQKKYMKQSKSFTPQLVGLYSILLVLAIVVFLILNIVTNQQKIKMAEQITNIGNMESLIVKELQRRQEQERQQLADQIKGIMQQLELIQKQKEQFEKSQIAALNAKTKEIEDEYAKKIEEEKNKLLRGLISKAEYDKRVKELIAEKEKRLKEAREQNDAQRKVYLEQLASKENELKAKENTYRQALAEKEKQIEQANQKIKAAEEKLALSEEAQKKMALENEQLKQSSAIQLKIRETISYYYKSILIYYRNNDRNGLKKSLNDLYSFIFNNPSSAIIAEEEKLFDKFVIDLILEDINKKENDEQKKLEKTKLFEKAYNEHKKGNLIASYEAYYNAFLKYDITVENEKFYFEDFLKLVFEKQSQEVIQSLENEATPLFNSIVIAFQNKNYQQVIQFSNNFLSSYSNSKNALKVVEYKIKSEYFMQTKKQEDEAYNIYQKAKTAYNNKDYDTTIKLLLELFSEYGGTSYATLGAELLQSIYISMKQNIAAAGVTNLYEETYEGNEIKVGNVFKIFPEVVQILKDQNLSIQIEVGTKLIVKSKNDSNTFTLVAVVEVSSIATTIINAKIVKIYGKGPSIGDYVFIIKK